MSFSAKAKRAEIDKNLKRFLQLLPDLLSEHQDSYVLMRDRNVVDYFDTAIDAQIAGNQKFDDRLFSIQHVKEVAEELGQFSHAIHPRRA